MLYRNERKANNVYFEIILDFSVKIFCNYIEFTQFLSVLNHLDNHNKNFKTRKLVLDLFLFLGYN